ncbi:MAG TPA: glycosyltransferase family 1 protein, partial [Verrucomicrobiae bacterium]|nr:glycosyltransferase family 1 protein [Verrucomicrobiae bacterium]
MRIAYISADPGVPVFGSKGCSIHVQEVLRALLKRGAEVDLLATSCQGNAPKSLEAVRLHPLPPAPKGELAVREQLSLSANDQLLGALRKLGGAGLEGRAFDLIYERYSLWSFAGMEYGRATGTPAVL